MKAKKQKRVKKTKKSVLMKKVVEAIAEDLRPVYELRIPMTEQYAYIHTAFRGTAEEALSEYRRITQLATGGVGMDTQDFNKVIDTMMADQPIQDDPGIIQMMNLEQQFALQTVKRAKARLRT